MINDWLVTGTCHGHFGSESRSRFRCGNILISIHVVLVPSQCRKQHIIMTILGNHIIEGHCYCFSKIEQKYENLHTIFNSLERRFACYKNKSLQYFHCLRAYYNIIRTGPQGPHEMPILPQYYIKLAVQIESNLSHH